LKILLLGKSGLLGSCFLKQLAGCDDFEMFAFDHAGLDICDEKAVDDVFVRISPDLVINCTAYTAVDKAEEDKKAAFAVNAEAVGRLAKLCKRENAKLIHFSTEYVFDGENPYGYAEDADYSPINVYGESKMEGEKLILLNMKDFYIIRTSWLYGENGQNFVDLMVKLLRDKDELNVVTDQVGSPTYAMDLCRAVIDQFLDENTLDFGIYHLTNDEVVSRYDWVKHMANHLKLTTILNAVNSDFFPTVANRPNSSILINSKTEKMRPWNVALNAYIDLHF